MKIKDNKWISSCWTDLYWSMHMLVPAFDKGFFRLILWICDKNNTIRRSILHTKTFSNNVSSLKRVIIIGKYRPNNQKLIKITEQNIYWITQTIKMKCSSNNVDRSKKNVNYSNLKSVYWKKEKKNCRIAQRWTKSKQKLQHINKIL